MFTPPARRLPRPSVPDGTRPLSQANLMNPLPAPPIQTHSYPGGTLPQVPPLQTQPSFPPTHRDSREHQRDRTVASADHPRRGGERDRTGSGENRDRERKKDRPHKSKDGKYIISPEEDIRRLMEECEMARGNAQFLSSQLAYAKPRDLTTNDVIKVGSSFS